MNSFLSPKSPTHNLNLGLTSNCKISSKAPQQLFHKTNIQINFPMNQLKDQKINCCNTVSPHQIKSTSINLQTEVRGQIEKKNQEDAYRNTNFINSYYLGDTKKDNVGQEVCLTMDQAVSFYKKTHETASMMASQFDDRTQWLSTQKNSKILLSTKLCQQNYQSKILEEKKKERDIKNTFVCLFLFCFYIHQKQSVRNFYSKVKQIQSKLTTDQQYYFHLFNLKQRQKFQKDKISISSLKQQKQQTIPETTNKDQLEMLKKLRIFISKKTDDYRVIKEIEKKLQINPNCKLAKSLKENTELDYNSALQSPLWGKKVSKMINFEVGKMKEQIIEKNLTKYLDLDVLQSKMKKLDNQDILLTVRKSLIRSQLQAEQRSAINNNKRLLTADNDYYTNQLQECKILNGASQLALTQKQIDETLESSYRNKAKFHQEKYLSQKKEKFLTKLQKSQKESENNENKQLSTAKNYIPIAFSQKKKTQNFNQAMKKRAIDRVLNGSVTPDKYSQLAMKKAESSCRDIF